MFFVCFFNDTATTEIYTLSLHDALPIQKYKKIIITITNKHKNVFTGLSNDGVGRAEIEKALMDWNIEIKRCMKKRGMFGSSTDQDSLM